MADTRKYNYTGFLEYLLDLGLLLKELKYDGSWKIWIDGSFVTSKINPLDIDILNIKLISNSDHLKRVGMIGYGLEISEYVNY